MATEPADLPLSAPVDKRRMCEMLGWSRPTLDKKLREDPFFPVLKAGQGKRDPWEFDPRAVLDYVRNGKLSLAGREPDQVVAAPAEEPPAQVRPAIVAVAPAPAAAPAAAVTPTPDKSGRVVNHAEVTTKAEKDQLAVELTRDKLRLSRGELIERETVMLVLSEVFAGLGSFFDMLPDTLVKVGLLPEENIGRVIKLLKAEREHTVQKIEKALSPE